jgi:hypothetical protein
MRPALPGEAKEDMPDRDALPHQVVSRRVLIEADNLLWDQYAVYVDLFKFYVDLAWKSTTWYYAITGVVLAYVFNNADRASPIVEYALLLPIVLSYALCAMYVLGALQTKDLEERMDNLCAELNLTGIPHVNILRLFLLGGALLCFGVGSVILFVFVRGF